MKLSAFFLEFWAVICLVFPLSASFILLSLRFSRWQGSEHFAKTIIDTDKAIVVLVQLVSHILGLILVQALCLSKCTHFFKSCLLTTSRHSRQDLFPKSYFEETDKS